MFVVKEEIVVEEVIVKEPAAKSTVSARKTVPNADAIKSKVPKKKVSLKKSR